MNPSHVQRIVNPRDVAGRVIVEIAKNAAMKLPAVRKIRARLGRTALPPGPEQLDRYVFQLFNAVNRNAGSVAGKSILEIGPGDNIVTGLAFLAAGAKSYTVLDRFPGAYTSPTAVRWYRLLADNWPNGPWPAHLVPERFPDGAPVFVRGLAVEIAGGTETYDVVCSYAVGEHVSDIHAFAALTRNALKPDGVAVHVIDFGGHQWNAYGDPFLFMKFPESIWNMMGSARGEPNRVRYSEYRQCFEQAGLSVKVASKRLCEFDPADPFVRQRANDSFLTTDAEFVLRVISRRT